MSVLNDLDETTAKFIEENKQDIIQHALDKVSSEFSLVEAIEMFFKNSIFEDVNTDLLEFLQKIEDKEIVKSLRLSTLAQAIEVSHDVALTKLLSNIKTTLKKSLFLTILVHHGVHEWSGYSAASECFEKQLEENDLEE